MMVTAAPRFIFDCVLQYCPPCHSNVGERTQRDCHWKIFPLPACEWTEQLDGRRVCLYWGWRREVENPEQMCRWYIFPRPHCRSQTLQESHEHLTAIKIWEEEILERSASIRFDTPELPASHMWIPSALAIFINLLIQKIIKGNMVVGKRHETWVSSFKMIYLFEKFNVRVLRVLLPKEFLVEARICWWL